jgi:hypothetical protein
MDVGCGPGNASQGWRQLLRRIASHHDKPAVVIIVAAHDRHPVMDRLP